MQPEYVAPHRLLRRALAVGGDRPRAPSSHCGKLILASLFAVSDQVATCETSGWKKECPWFRIVIARACDTLDKAQCSAGGTGANLPVGGSSVRRAKNSIRSIKISASNGRISCRAKLTARHKLSPSGLRIKCFKGDKQIRRFLAKRGQITLLGRVQIALNLNTDAVPSLNSRAAHSG